MAGSSFFAGSFVASLVDAVAGLAGVAVVFLAAAAAAAAIGFLATGDFAFETAVAAVVAAAAMPIAVPVTTRAAVSEPTVAESETGLSTCLGGSTVSCVLLTST